MTDTPEPQRAVPPDRFEALLSELIDVSEREGDAAASAFVAAHPEHACELREARSMLDDIGMLESDQAPLGPQPAPRIGGYSIRRRIGRGGMGQVYLAEQETTGRLVALKLVRGGSWLGDRGRERFRREARSLARIRHESVVRVYEAGESDGALYIAMEYVRGRGLDAVFRDSAADPRSARIAETVRHGRDLARALDEIHRHGIVHRDVKPSNVRVRPDGRAVLIDFGLARDLGQPSISVTGSFVGSPHYAAPEQVSPSWGAVGPATDVYSLGVTLYEGVVGQPAFRGDSTEEVLRQVVSCDPPAPLRIAPAIGVELDTVLRRAIEKRPGDRYADAGALADDLDALLELRPVAARPVGIPGRALKWARRNPARSAAICVAALLVVAAVARGVMLASVHERTHGAREARAAQLARTRDAAYRRLADVRLVADLEEEARALWPRRPAQAPAMERWLWRAVRLLGRLPGHRAQLDEIRARGAAGGEAGPVLASHEDRWQQQIMADLVRRLDAFAGANGLVAAVSARLALAREVRERTVDEHAAAWARTAAATRERLGFELAPITGLIPLGADPVSGLGEFWLWESGARPEREAGTRRWRIETDTAIVLVLLPGGSARLGTDGDADSDEHPAYDVELAPFMIAKYEITQAQWQRIAGENPAVLRDVDVGAGRARPALHPVENASWRDCVDVMGRVGLSLPTEAQWEYAARAGARTRWSTGDTADSLAGHANVADTSSRGFLREVALDVTFDDGVPQSAPVGRYAPNGFGLHDVHGNVCEWCLDRHGSYEGPVRPGDRLRFEASSTYRVFRGGSFYRPAEAARSAKRYRTAEDGRGLDIGCRPVLAVRSR